MQYTAKSLDAAIEKFAPHTKISKPGRTTALTMAIVEAFLKGDVSSKEALTLRSAKHDLSENGQFYFADGK